MNERDISLDLKLNLSIVQSAITEDSLWIQAIRCEFGASNPQGSCGYMDLPHE